MVNSGCGSNSINNITVSSNSINNITVCVIIIIITLVPLVSALEVTWIYVISLQSSKDSYRYLFVYKKKHEVDAYWFSFRVLYFQICWPNCI
jgi:hypothetical protein